MRKPKGVERAEIVGRSGGTPAASQRSILLIDESEPFARAMETELSCSAVVWRASSFPAARAILRSKGPPSYVVSELRVAGQPLFQFLTALRAHIAIERIFIVTAYPSVASAVRFTRLGVAEYLTKPVRAVDLLDLMTSRYPHAGGLPNPSDALAWPTLRRTMWEYISRIHLAAGSTAEAARRLGIDRRSLRRMLAKHPPPR